MSDHPEDGSGNTFVPPGGTQYGNAVMSAPLQPLLFPASTDYIGQNPQQNIVLFAKAPWFHHMAYRNYDLIMAYCHGFNARLPGNLPVSCVLARSWKLHGAIPLNFVKVHAPNRPYGGWEAYVRLVYQRLYRTPGRVSAGLIVPSQSNLDVGIYRVAREIPYCNALEELGLPATWGSHEPQVHNEALLLGQQLRTDFRFRRRTEDRRMFDKLKWERSVRNRLGVLVPYHHVEVELVNRDRLRDLYLPIPQEWAMVETCNGFIVELPPVLSYCICELKSPGISGLWTVLYTEFVALTAANWMRELYDSYRMWYLMPTVRQLIKQLDLQTVLGGAQVEQELHALMQIFEIVNWDNPEEVPPENKKSWSSSGVHFSSGRQHAECGDFIFFSPWRRTRILSEDIQHERELAPQRPLGLETGYHVPVAHLDAQTLQTMQAGSAAILANTMPAPTSSGGVNQPVLGDGEDVMEDEIVPVGSPTVAAAAAPTASAVPTLGSTSNSADMATRTILLDLLRSSNVPADDLEGLSIPELRNRRLALANSRSSKPTEDSADKNGAPTAQEVTEESAGKEPKK